MSYILPVLQIKINVTGPGKRILKSGKCPLLCGSKVPEMVMVMAQETSGEPQ